MSELCEHETFKDVCGICHRDGVITRLRADNLRLTRQFAEHADRTADDTAALRDEVERLRAALRGLIGAVTDHTSQKSIPHALTEARAALDGQPAPGKEEA